MKKIAKITLVLFIIILFSCDNHFGVGFEIRNNTDRKIDSVTVTNGFHFVNLKNLEAKEVKSGFIDFKVGNPKYDGNYSIEVYNKSDVKKRLFGYYSNGIPGSLDFNITILKDTIVIEELTNK